MKCLRSRHLILLAIVGMLGAVPAYAQLQYDVSAPLQEGALMTTSACQNELHGSCRTACLEGEDVAGSCSDASLGRTCCVQRSGDGNGLMPAGDPRGSDTQLYNPFGGKTIVDILNRIIQTFLGVIGAIALLVFFYAGVVYMTAGNSDRIKTAVNAMKYAALGLMIILFAYVISSTYIRAITSS